MYIFMLVILSVLCLFIGFIAIELGADLVLALFLVIVPFKHGSFFIHNKIYGGSESMKRDEELEDQIVDRCAFDLPVSVYKLQKEYRKHYYNLVINTVDELERQGRIKTRMEIGDFKKLRRVIYEVN